MPRSDPLIVEHVIKMYPNAKPIRKKLHPINPRKATSIKKLLPVSFIYPIPLTKWVSNLVLVEKDRVPSDFSLITVT